MTAMSRAGACALDEHAARALGHALRDAGYGGGTAALIGGDVLSVLARLFSLGASVSRDAAALALDSVGLAALEQAGIIERCADGRISSRMRITPHEGLLFLHDRGDPRGPSDQVAAVGPASRTLASLTIGTQVDLALDLGTGCGIQALLAARHAGRVIATDVSARAIGVARVNAAMNGIDNVELRCGDLFEPVRGERFGLIVANPPFVISPETSHQFRDSDLVGDEVSRRVLSEAAEHLADGGHATVLCEWVRREGEAWRDVPARWIEDRGCDALALHYRTSDPETYAAGWNAGLRDRNPDDYVDTVERWVAYQRTLGAAGVSTGALVLRRAAGPGSWFRAEEMPAGPSGAASEHLLRLFAAQDVIPVNREELLEVRLAPVSGQVLRQLLVLEEAGWQAADAELHIEPGIGVSITVPAPVVHVLLSLDGVQSLAAVVEQAAVELGAEPETLRGPAIDVARRLLELGLATL